MIRRHATRGLPATLATVTVLLSACGGPSSTAKTQNGGPATEQTLSDGVRVLSQDGPRQYVRLSRGRHAVRLTPSLLYEVDVPEGAVTYAGTSLYLPGAAGPLMLVERAPSNTKLAAHPCHDHGQTFVGPTVRDLASALRRQPFLEVTRPVPVTVGGHGGLFLTVAVPKGADLTRCEDDRVDLYTREDPLGAVTVDKPFAWQLWIFEVGGTRYVARGDLTPNASKSDRAALAQMVESITFTVGE
jgi:hypothetical protein